MSEPRTVTLEILRHGPPHNQLLSPLTQYLALCGNHPAVTVHVPFEHKHLLTRLRAFSYKDSEETRQLQIKETAEIMGNFLAQIPGLIAELADGGRAGSGGKRGFTHMRLVLSASELALLPLELATSPNGFPAAGQSLILQSQSPLCITREVRRHPGGGISWMNDGESPRILFVAAAPLEAGRIPFDAHLLILRKVIEPWVCYSDEQNEEAWAAELDNHLVVLPQASVEQIQRECARRSFTHVHILAHGIPVREAGDDRTGLALHDSHDPSRLDIVDGARLASLLHPYELDGNSRPPCVVTLAVCDSGNVGAVEGSGGSVAHALHESGIPLVVASQFPLTFAASILMVEMYERLLWGEDPRMLLLCLRQQLRTRITQTDQETSDVTSTHDWASLVTYASLPEDLGERTLHIEVGQAAASIRAAFSRYDGELRKHNLADPKSAQPKKKALPDLMKTRKTIEDAKQRLEEIAGRCIQERVQIEGLLASTEKRLAENIFFEFQCNASPAGSPPKQSELLRRSIRHYEAAYEADRNSGWALVQQLVLEAALNDKIEKITWDAAWSGNYQDLHNAEPKRMAWALGSLIELCLLAKLQPHLASAVKNRLNAVEFAERLNESPEMSEIYNTRRQIRRYSRWFSKISPQAKLYWASVSREADQAATALTRADDFVRPLRRSKPGKKK